MKCPECGFLYCEDIPSDVKQHLTIHHQFLDAKSQYKHIYLYEEEENLKRHGWDIVCNETVSLTERLFGAEQICYSYYSRSMSQNGFSSKHPNISDYIAMLLDAKEHLESKWGSLVYNSMVEKYGTKPGITHGFTIFKL